ncbi:LON peptidase substrate-binding domain-containing protein [Mycobacteroides immunogenum]|uniref:LON peptidase substrate-binding domain-containing protein n=1 Tax=Mycobacteroides immunogenum TaxID=83262 RepID=UPI0025B77B33|nr:LON peptidase substrate-binding domain-containing protein [Mycobacteroides immunogenum]WJR33230.1 LON peptidase substrate-binding domain-containing protein [Mycobacteroides immunogenum]
MTPMFPLQSVLLPGEPLPLRIFEPRYVALVRDVMAADRTFGVVLIARGREVGGGDVRNDVGTAARVLDCESLGADRFALSCEGAHRIRITHWLDDDPYPRAEVQPWPDEPDERVLPLSALNEVQMRIENLLRRVAAARQVRLSRRWSVAAGLPTGAEKRLWALASRVPMGQADRYAVLAAPTLEMRAAALNEAIDTVEAMLDFRETER